jgi:hypothetical protein
MHHKRRKRKRNKGCCGWCSLRTTNGLRNGRQPTLHESAAEVSADEQLQDVEVVHSPKRLVLHSRW